MTGAVIGHRIGCRIALAAGLLLLAPAALAGPQAGCEGLVASQGWIRQAPPSAMALAGYAQLANRGRKPVVVDGLASADFGRAEIHENALVDGQMRMRRVPELTIAPGETVALAPGGRHLMLMQPRSPQAASSHLELHCRDGGSLALDLPLRAEAPTP